MADVLENQTVVKKDDNTITITKSVPVKFEFTPEYLKEQRARIVEQKERDNAQRDLEILEVDAYIAKCTELEVVEKPVVEPAKLEALEPEVVEEAVLEEVK